ncbi:hypothetical protein, partial [Coleofasciculus sp. H7-2]|uniref:hypothetical protein n=1 Tax=Coleofasciculus sp. H7-2 TaxID=3351545 RepID=UPI00366CC1AB
GTRISELACVGVVMTLSILSHYHALYSRNYKKRPAISILAQRGPTLPQHNFAVSSKRFKNAWKPMACKGCWKSPKRIGPLVC